MIEIQAPNKIPKNVAKIFLAGTIDMGSSENWQKKVVEYLKDEEDIIVLNPRRDDWDKSWEQKIENPNFYKQVSWELNALEISDLIIVNFLPGSQSPISLMELGLFASSKKIAVCCPEGFYRKGNVDIVCEKYKIPLFETIEELLSNLDFIN